MRWRGLRAGPTSLVQSRRLSESTSAWSQHQPRRCHFTFATFQEATLTSRPSCTYTALVQPVAAGRTHQPRGVRWCRQFRRDDKATTSCNGSMATMTLTDQVRNPAALPLPASSLPAQTSTHLADPLFLPSEEAYHFVPIDGYTPDHSTPYREDSRRPGGRCCSHGPRCGRGRRDRTAFYWPDTDGAHVFHHYRRRQRR